MLNIQRQQQQRQELHVTPLDPSVVAKERASLKEGGQSGVPSVFAQCSESVDIREPSKAPLVDPLVTVKTTLKEDPQTNDPQFPGTLVKSCTRGLSSLLMPPSVRRKLEAVAEVQRQETSSAQDAENAARYLILESTCRGDDFSEAIPFISRQLIRPGRGYDPGSFDGQFTARTERPLKHTHLRELYKVEQEMHDMSDALSSISFTNSTISEVDELEVLPYEGS